MAKQWQRDLLQVASASSEPSGHSGSPSQRQRPGTHWPFMQANSAGAHVFLAARTPNEMMDRQWRGQEEREVAYGEERDVEGRQNAGRRGKEEGEMADEEMEHERW